MWHTHGSGQRGYSNPDRAPDERLRVSYPPCRRRTISVIQMGANGDVQPGGVG